jgi:hypothetical protein
VTRTTQRCERATRIRLANHAASRIRSIPPGDIRSGPFVPIVTRYAPLAATTSDEVADSTARASLLAVSRSERLILRASVA